MLNKISAICLLVSNYQKSLDFYTKMLKLKTGYIDEKGGFASFELGETSLAMFQKDKAVGMFPAKLMKPSGGFLIGYQVKNLDKECKKLKEKGIKMFEGPKETSWGQRVAYFHDPDENIWEISEPFEDK